MKYIKGYDGLRAISIGMVFYSHLPFGDHPADPVMSDRNSMIFSGDMGVKIFFVLSGFLITRILLQEKHTTGRISFANFYMRRFIRLLPPLILFYSALIVCMGLGLIDAQWIGLTFSVFYLYNFVPKKYYTGELGPMWSLGVEEQFYLFWPVIIHFFRRNIHYMAGIVVLLCIIAKIYLPGIIVFHAGRFHSLNDYTFLDRWFLPAVAPVMIGAISSFMIFNREEKWCTIFSKAFILILPLSLYFLPIYVPRIFFLFTYGIELLQICGIAGLLLWIFFNQKSILTGVLEFKPVAYTGKISYGLYVYHSFFIRTGPGNLFVQQYPLNIFLTAGTAILSYEFIEKRVLKLKTKFTLQ